MASVNVERPRTTRDIKALIRKRERNIAQLEAVLAMPMPAQDKAHLRLRLRGEKMNRQSWINYLEKKAAA